VPIQGEGPRSWLGPLAVLVGPRSASAAEALAALIGETRRGLTVGERTAGALTGASLETLPDGGQLSIAQFDVRTPGGARIEGRGYLPAHVVPLTPDDEAAGRDPQLAAAMTLLAPARPSLSLAESLHAQP
jgi:C-terminal processing protease CtpA/Prc